jgi:hypothetical protein
LFFDQVIQNLQKSVDADFVVEIEGDNRHIHRAGQGGLGGGPATTNRAWRVQGLVFR